MDSSKIKISCNINRVARKPVVGDSSRASGVVGRRREARARARRRSRARTVPPCREGTRAPELPVASRGEGSVRRRPRRAAPPPAVRARAPQLGTAAARGEGQEPRRAALGTPPEDPPERVAPGLARHGSSADRRGARRHRGPPAGALLAARGAPSRVRGRTQGSHRGRRRALGIARRPAPRAQGSRRRARSNSPIAPAGALRLLARVARCSPSAIEAVRTQRSALAQTLTARRDRVDTIQARLDHSRKQATLAESDVDRRVRLLESRTTELNTRRSELADVRAEIRALEEIDRAFDSASPAHAWLLVEGERVPRRHRPGDRAHLGLPEEFEALLENALGADVFCVLVKSRAAASHPCSRCCRTTTWATSPSCRSTARRSPCPAGPGHAAHRARELRRRHRARTRRAHRRHPRRRHARRRPSRCGRTRRAVPLRHPLGQHRVAERQGARRPAALAATPASSAASAASPSSATASRLSTRRSVRPRPGGRVRHRGTRGRAARCARARARRSQFSAGRLPRHAKRSVVSSSR